MPDRELDLVVFGATSVTGRRVAAYLGERAPATEARWAAAARDLSKLERVLAEEGVEAPESIAAEIDDAGSLRRMAERATTVVNLVGPYTRYGEPVIAACVDAGTNYVDLTGEIPFSRRILDRYGDAAEQAGAKIVQTAGFESLPPDLGVMLATETMRERSGQTPITVDLEIALTRMPNGLPRASDMVSGGTLQSMAAIAGDADADKLADPALLIDDPDDAAAVRAASPINLMPRRNAAGAVIAPMSPAAFINPAVIQRSAALAAAAHGQPFVPFAYREGVAIAGGLATLPLRYGAAGMLSAIQAGLAAAAGARPAIRDRVSSSLARILPSSGFGPAADRLADWGWQMLISARSASGATTTVTIDADGHPGYLATARMMGEAGLMLSENGATPALAGCLTPAIALGIAGLDRFAAAKLRFSVA